MLKNLALLLLTLGAAPVLVACQPKCDSTSCRTGCCDATGTCRLGTLATACGAMGATCQSCGAGTTCNLGACVFGGTGGGSGGGAGSGVGGATGTGAGGGTGGAGLSVCNDYAQSSVDRFVRCGAMTQTFAAYYRTFLAAQCSSTTVGTFASLKDGRATLNDTGLQMCLTSVRTASCASDDVCSGDEVFDGTVGINGDCFGDLDCQDALFCESATTCPGKCIPRIPIGQPVNPNQQCVKTGYPYGGVCTALVAGGGSCAPMSGESLRQRCVSPNVCQSDVCGPAALRATLNGPCRGDFECALGLQCVASVCVPLGPLNAACDSARRCQQGLTCSPSNTCVDATPANIGNPCGDGVPCVQDAFCNITAGVTTGTCAPTRVEGGSCTSSGNECASGFSCSANFMTMTGVCRRPGALSAPCTYATFDACQSGLYCTATAAMMSGACANKKGEGASCAYADECQSSFCVSMLCTRPTCSDPTP